MAITLIGKMNNGFVIAAVNFNHADASITEQSGEAFFFKAALATTVKYNINCNNGAIRLPFSDIRLVLN